MKEIEYPFDSEYIITKKREIKRKLLQAKESFLEKKIAILGGSTTNDIKQIMELFLLDNGIKPIFYESEYNKYYEDSVFDNSKLQEFSPDVIYIYTTNRNITKYPLLEDSTEAIRILLENEYERFEFVWQNLTDRYHCPIIQNNFEMPYYRLLGNRDVYDVHGATNFLERLNRLFYQYAQNNNNFYLCDLNYISADYGLRKWADPFYWYMYKYALAVPAIPYLAYNVANIIKSLFGKNKKGFVLDLDNTLWGGVVGEDGVENLVLGPEQAQGQAYSEFQQYIKAHQQLGVILNINSKNDMENAMAGIHHPNSNFTEEDFICIKANWDSKDKNYQAIADELSLLPESLVFIDDNPAERHIVTEQFIGVCAPELADISHYIELVDRSGFFEVTDLSGDDLNRKTMYQENAARSKLKSCFADYGEFLASLQMKAEIKSFEQIYMSRITQLTNKSNQFNLTTKRYTQVEIEALADNDDYITLYGKLEDRFGDNGLVSVVIAHIVEKICHIELWVMSCRVLKRDMEYAMMDVLVHGCAERGIYELRGYYYPTNKNHMVERFYEKQGFKLIDQDEEGNSEWSLALDENYQMRNKYIKVKEEG